jgi:Flp pilus assembly protein protease CpaA
MESVEIFGYFAMIVVLISMLMTDIKKLRITNSIASLMFFIYGLFLSAYPIVVMNALVIMINLYKLYKTK